MKFQSMPLHPNSIPYQKNTSLFFHKQPILYLTFHHPIPFQRTVVFVNLRIAHRWSFLVYLVKPNLLETCTSCRPANLAEARLPWDDFWSQPLEIGKPPWNVVERCHVKWQMCHLKFDDECYQICVLWNMETLNISYNIIYIYMFISFDTQFI